MMRPVDLLTPGASALSRPALRAAQPAGTPFAGMLEQELAKPAPVTFSRHATERLDDRRIALTAADRAGLEQAVDEAAAKGGRESLVLLGKLALVVSVPNRTVITAVPADEASAHVFTNIDSAVVAPR